ncbi:MAG: hypothetical protein QOC82_1091 [Frankiaceae bacterium]|nr:hypothetical protein [Frankiaceae bacterium]
MPDEPSAPPPDPYEYGFDVAQRRRQPLPEMPEEPRRRFGGISRDTWKWTLGALAVLTTIAITRGVQATREGSLKPNCGRFQVKVAEHSVVSRGGQLLRWSATSAPGVRYVVAVNATSVTLEGTVATAVPAVGAAGQASRLETMGRGCLGRGSFGVLLPPGTYPVTLFRVDGSAVRPVASTTVKVTP